MGYYELPEDEVPDMPLWHDPKRLEEWFAAVKQRREEGGSPHEDDPGEMTQNELTRELIGDLK